MDITIRKYRPEDLPVAIAVFQLAVRLIAAKDYNQQQTEAWSQVDRNDWKRRLDNGDIWVASHANQLIGFTKLAADGHLDLLFTDADFQRCGVATLLLDKVEQIAAEQGLTQIVTEASITAKPFFLQRGYQLLVQQSVLVRGQHFINFRMRKLLSDNDA